VRLKNGEVGPSLEIVGAFAHHSGGSGFGDDRNDLFRLQATNKVDKLRT